jgi:hypothetical protein
VTVWPTALQALRDVVIGVLGAVAAIVLVVAACSSGGRLAWTVVGALAVSVGLAGALVTVLVRRWGRAQIAELQRGYTTTTFEMGRFWFSAAPDAPITLGWVQWDWSATWVLRSDGTVRSAPSGDGDPPGLYPSHSHGGSLELWTGRQWSGYVPRAHRGSAVRPQW